MAKKASIKNNSALDRMFERTDVPHESESKKTPDRAKKKRATKRRNTKQVSLMLYQDQLPWVESVCADALKGGGKKILKAQLVRVMIDLCKEKGLD